MLRLALISMVSVMLAASCGVGPELRGSIEEQMELEFDELTLHRHDNVLVVEYRRHQGNSMEVPCRLTVDVLGMRRRSAIHLRAEAFHERVHLERVMLAGGSFPGVRATGGQLWLDPLDPGAVDSASGEFHVVFVNGRTLYGSFYGAVE